MFFSDFGSVTLRSAFSGRRESLRLFRATPPAAIPANAAPPAISGVFAFEANSATFPPAFAKPFGALVCRAELVRRLALGLLLVLDRELLEDELEEPLLLLLLFLPLEPLEVLEEPFLLADLLELERLRVDRLLEDRVVWAMVIASLGFRASCAFSHRRSHWTYPLSSEFERPPARGLNGKIRVKPEHRSAA
jgi:hypothetical protein